MVETAQLFLQFQLLLRVFQTNLVLRKINEIKLRAPSCEIINTLTLKDFVGRGGSKFAPRPRH